LLLPQTSNLRKFFDIYFSRVERVDRVEILHVLRGFNAETQRREVRRGVFSSFGFVLNILDDESCERKAEDRRRVRDGAVYAGL